MADVKYVVSVDSKGAVKEIERLGEAMKKAEGQTEGLGGASVKAGAGMEGLTGKIAAGTMIASYGMRAIAGFVSSIGKMVKAAMTQEKAEREVEAALRLTGRTIEGNLENYKKFAEGLQRVTKYSDDEVLSAEALVLQMTNLDQRGVQRVIKGATGLASTLGGDLRQAVMLVTTAMEGNVGALARYGIKVEEGLSAEEKREAILKRLEGMYGRAEDELNTFGGAVGQLKNYWSDVEKAVGGAIVRNKDVMTLIKGLSERLRAFVESDRFKLYLSALSEWLAKVVKGVGAVGNAVDWLTKKLTGASGWDEYLREMERMSGAIQGGANVIELRRRAIEEEIVTVQEWGEMWRKYGKNYGEMIRAISEGREGEGLKRLFEEVRDKTERARQSARGLKGEIIEVGNIPATRTKEEIEALEKAAEEARGKIVALKSDISGMVVKVDMEGVYRTFAVEAGKYEALSGAIGGALGRVVGDVELVKNKMEEWGGEIGSVERAWSGMTRTEMVDRLVELRRELERMVRSGKYTQTEIDKIKMAIKGLEGELRDTPGWVRKFASAMESIKEVADVIWSGLDAIFAQSQRNKEIMIENEYKKRVDAIKRSAMSEEEQVKAIEALEAEYQIKKTSAQRAAAKQAKAVAVMEAMVNTAVAVSKALAQGGFLLGIPWAAVVGALGMAQVGMIMAQPIPLARGAVFKKRVEMVSERGGKYEMGEEGVEYLLPEKHLVDLLWKVPEYVREARGEERGGGVVININTPLVRAVGVSRVDLEMAGEELVRIIEREMRRRGR